MDEWKISHRNKSLAQKCGKELKTLTLSLHATVMKVCQALNALVIKDKSKNDCLLQDYLDEMLILVALTLSCMVFPKLQVKPHYLK